jgi:hypothetical protein
MQPSAGAHGYWPPDRAGEYRDARSVVMLHDLTQALELLS